MLAATFKLKNRRLTLKPWLQIPSCLFAEVMARIYIIYIYTPDLALGDPSTECLDPQIVLEASRNLHVTERSWSPCSCAVVVLPHKGSAQKC